MDFALLGRKKQTLAVFVIFFLSLAIILSFVQTFKYSAKTKLLVIQNFPAGTDPFAVSRANKYLSTVLSEIVPSYSFYKDILESGFNIDRNYFSKEAKINTELKKWKKTVEAKAINDTGILEITVYHPDRGQADQIVRAINYTLKTKHQLYHGGGGSVTVKTIDDPVMSDYPVKPNLFMNMALAVIFGLTLGAGYVLLFPDNKYDLHIMPKGSENRPAIKYTDPDETRSPEPTESHDLEAIMRQRMIANRIESDRQTGYAPPANIPFSEPEIKRDSIAKQDTERAYPSENKNETPFKGDIKNILG